MNDIIFEKQDLRALRWSKVRHSSTTSGSFLKAIERVDGHDIYYKLSDFDTIDGIVGVESLNEIVVDRLLTLLGIEHLSYQLIHAAIIINDKEYDTYLCASKSFRTPGDQKVSLESFYELNHSPQETPLDFCKRMGWAQQIYEMLLCDYLVLNRDRHGANIEVLKDTTDKFRLAPLYDHGVSLLCRSRTESEILDFDVMADKRVQSFVGSGSAYKNLSFIPRDVILTKACLKESDREKILDGLEDLYPPHMADKIWEMIWQRWCVYANL